MIQAITFDFWQTLYADNTELLKIREDHRATQCKEFLSKCNYQFTLEEIKKCEKNANLSIKIKNSEIPMPQTKTKGARYTPLSKRADKPSGIYWVLKNLPEVPDSKICKIIGTTKKTVQSIRDRTYWNIQNIRAQNPHELGLCTREELENLIQKYRTIQNS